MRNSDKYIMAYRAMVNYLHRQDSLREILEGIPPANHAWPSPNNFSELLGDLCAILEVSNIRATSRSRSMAMKLITKVHQDKLHPGTDIYSKYAAYCLYCFLLRVKGELDQDLPILHPGITTPFSAEGGSFPSRFEFASVNRYEEEVSEELVTNASISKSAEIAFMESSGNLY